ncbi:MAG: hypothetical protein E7J62_03560 [Serratia marcescens]|uniref:hypothetical protein n=1 Tax=Serratia TaxID=613 RepID=UPI0006684A0F|nr:hypothetical protein [Serratia marcescens]SBL84788.1 Uncharacterised protein [Klebsiella oxytoca]AWQ49485.1 hypothetical protein B1A42_19955 [Serratia marcescens]MDU7803702.1 hypothetical protein [Serratia marcescens]BEN41527.1 hypothetical protein SMKC049_33190 [Serratia marcescens]HEO8934933.1 hypothetical protein [Serratia marcescens]
MTALTGLIARHKQLFSEHPFLDYVRDNRIPVQSRLAFLPAMSHFVMSFSDLNKYALPFPSPKDPLEHAVNTHAKEDSHHWPWFLHDLQTLSLNTPTTLVDNLRFLWSDQLQASRRLVYHLFALCANKPAKQRIVVIEMIESVGNAVFTVINQVVNEAHIPLKYCGDLHLSRETGHAIGSHGELLDTLAFSQEEEREARAAVESGFQAFSSFFSELADYANLPHPAR